ncbi:MAG: MBL fold metallo-hydrolase [Moorea sp. SIO4E2]|uniref:MBL fold metallo-hydrolase n=1 Tax=Moorena sp. SIO4E2 TaxID=2607826 RepID=UPI0013BD1124|nr:MBL fold metallo-hydrolase [Moorena sp. SIO4E2]NEQ09106.1 MBL fold metallo-hydrolase [Moorena sp. SIO4E2]
MYLTHFGANTWLLELPEQRILIDPWLVGSLVFGNLPWFFKGDKPEAINSIPDKIDLILLSQGLEDHTHTPTLEKLDKTIPVVGSTSAAKVVKQLGYTQVTPLTAGETVALGNHLEIRALPGAPIGPFQQENAYLITQLDSGTSLYYEPHGYPPAEVKDYAPVDIVISPALTLEIPLAGPIVQGHKTALQLAQWLRPQVFLPTTIDENVKYEGVLGSVVREVGSLEELRSQLLQDNLPTKVITPELGVSLEL